MNDIPDHIRDQIKTAMENREEMLIEKLAVRVAQILEPKLRLPPPRYVYLAGPIMGCTEFEANDWRAEVARQLLPHNIIGVSPLRCEPLHGETYSVSSPDPCFGVPRAIGSKNTFDVHTCDMSLIFLPKAPEGRVQSYGTIIELGWAKEDRKQTILVSNDDYINAHPVIDACCGWKLSTLAEAVRVIVGVLGGYTGGKNV